MVKKFKDAPHGFAVRGDDMVESEKQQKEEAYVLVSSPARSHWRQGQCTVIYMSILLMYCSNNDGITFVKKWFEKV